MRRIATALGAAITLATASAGAQSVPAAPSQPVFVEDFSGLWIQRWQVSGGLDPLAKALRIGTVVDPIGRVVGRVTVIAGDAMQGHNPQLQQNKRYVCDAEGSHAVEIRALGHGNGRASSDRAEFQLRYDEVTGAGELVRFDAQVWYRFGFKIAEDWPIDRPLEGREPCRTVIHQVKQDSYRDGKSCSASPFFKIEARPLGEHVRFYGQVASGPACARPPVVERTMICVDETVPRAAWNTVHIRMRPSVNADGRLDMWLNGVHCGSYAGPMGDAVDGARRDGRAIANAQPRFGIYRDWRAESQTIYFDRIAFWHDEPAADDADWRVGPLPPKKAAARQF